MNTSLEEIDFNLISIQKYIDMHKQNTKKQQAQQKHAMNFSIPIKSF